MSDLENNIEKELANCELQAIKSLAGYKFIMFGYWAAQWVLLNRVGKTKRPSPFKRLVHLSREILEEIK
tara:strand:+ start:1633 stop:1839 length:207 start_codon:yes stop_codon:yes gene_type:complete